MIMDSTNDDIYVAAANAGTLFHFTKTFDVLTTILEKGIRYSYAFEQHSYYENINMEEEERGSAIPMICFCDIPLLRTNEHRRRYGNYAIGLDKRYSKYYTFNLNPILYVHSAQIRKSVQSLFDSNIDLYNKLIKEVKDIKVKYDEGKYSEGDKVALKEMMESLYNNTYMTDNLLGMSKPYSSFNSDNEEVCYYDEREWRSISLKRDENFPWECNISYDDFKKNKLVWNNRIEQSNNGYLVGITGLFHYVISHIIVDKEKEVQDMIRFIMSSEKIFGADDLSESDRLVLISKITSFERIGFDY